MSTCVHVSLSSAVHQSQTSLASVALHCSWDASGQCDVKGGSLPAW